MSNPKVKLFFKSDSITILVLLYPKCTLEYFVIITDMIWVSCIHPSQSSTPLILTLGLVLSFLRITIFLILC